MKSLLSSSSPLLISTSKRQFSFANQRRHSTGIHQKRLIATHADLSGSTFTDVNLCGATFDDVKLASATITNCNLSGSHLENVNLSGVAIADCGIEGMTIDGLSVVELMAAYAKTRRASDL